MLSFLIRGGVLLQPYRVVFSFFFLFGFLVFWGVILRTQFGVF